MRAAAVPFQTPPPLRFADALAVRRHLGTRVPRLTPRQQQVYALTAHGLRVRSIARELGVTETCIRNLLKIVFATVGVSSQIELTELVWQARGRPRTVKL